MFLCDLSRGFVSANSQLGAKANHRPPHQTIDKRSRKLSLKSVDHFRRNRSRFSIKDLSKRRGLSRQLHYPCSTCAVDSVQSENQRRRGRFGIRRSERNLRGRTIRRPPSEFGENQIDGFFCKTAIGG